MDRREEVGRAEARRRAALSPADEELRRRDLDDLRAVMRTPEGRRVLGRVIYEFGRLNEQTYTGNSLGFFKDGERNVALRLLAALEDEDPELLELRGLMDRERLAQRAERLRRGTDD